MKITTRENFRVAFSGQVELKYLRSTPPLDQSLVSRVDVSGTVYPRRLGDFGFASVSDSFLAGRRDLAAEYEDRCKEIIGQIRDQYGSQVKTEIICDTSETCSHCGYEWSELGEDDVKDSPELAGEPHAGLGMPWCCEPAQVEWRAAQTAVTA